MHGNDIFRKLDNSFILRCKDRAAEADGWNLLTGTFTPLLEEENPVPFLLCREAGDLGLAMLWIVQAAVVRPLLSAMKGKAGDAVQSDIDSLGKNSIGSLAHSEPADNPVIYTDTDRGWILSGNKKYITGGIEADFLLTSARLHGEEKISSLFFIPRDKLPADSITPVLRDYMKTAPHGSLSLNSFFIEKGYRFDCPAGNIRRLILSAGLLERILVIEAITGLIIYLRSANGLSDDTVDSRLCDMAESIHGKYLAACKAFKSGERIVPAIPDMALLAQAIAPLESLVSSPPDGDAGERTRDLKFILSMIPGMKK